MTVTTKQEKTHPRPAIRAAEVAVSEEEYDVAEDAVLEALSRIRRRIQEGDV
jgi:ribosomal protein S20